MKKYWKSLEEYNGTHFDPGEEDQSGISALDLLSSENNESKTSRRDFLKWCGFSFMSATVLASCESPIKKAIPYLNQPEDITPGMASWYASSFYDGKDFCPVLVKVRDGRPIKIEGNKSVMLTHGGTTGRVQASVLSLYDTAGRYHHPYNNGEEITWEQADRDIAGKLDSARKDIVLLTSTIISPSTQEVINRFKNRYNNFRHVVYDAISYSAIREANLLSFNRREIPFYRFDRAGLIVGFNADFLANWLLPVTFTRQYADSRALRKDKKEMSHHLQFESGMSVTGANADKRFMIKPHEELHILQGTYNILAGNGNGNEPEYAKILAAEIRKNENKTLIVSGTNDIKVQTLVNAINYMAGSYGNTIDFTNSLNLCQGSDKDLQQLVNDMEAGKVSALIVGDANPVYDYPGNGFKNALDKVDLKVSFSSVLNETSELADYILPSPHYLESWDDVAPAKGFYGIVQPVIRPLFDTRQMQDSLLKWSDNDLSYKDLIKELWEKQIFTKQNKTGLFTAFWQESLQLGVFTPEIESVNVNISNEALATAGALQKAAVNEGWNLVFYESTALGDGRHANNPWLQELPDPVSKVCWDNFAAISQADAEALGLNNGDLIRLLDDVELPVIVQPGQTEKTVSVALGYGRQRSGKVAEGIGINVFSFVEFKDGYKKYNVSIDQLVKTKGKTDLALTQTHHNMEGRAIVRESVLTAWQNDPASGNELHEFNEAHKTTLYPEVKFEGHHWALAVDLNRCIGCSACVIACQAENNVPVIGKKEVMRRRIMHWMRIDRYYTGETDNPGVVFQPLMCQHCDNAPCENVCPVAATTHSDEGINQITYNRCVGTKYCINNCPYKVRRFNWFQYSMNKAFDYNMNDDIGRMVLNPDVTVRERGVVEKCSFCVQRIQEVKLEAKLENRKVMDGEIQPACVQACPGKALVFGDLNDPDSEVSKLFKDERNYHVLEEMHFLPTVGYLTKIRNV